MIFTTLFGCGDTVVGGMAVGRRRGLDFAETLRLAMACGLSNAARRGAGHIDPDQVQFLMERIDIRAL